MSSIVVQAFTTLDGVVQSGSGPDEDRDGGFEHGGWQQEYDDRGTRALPSGVVVNTYRRANAG